MKLPQVRLGARLGLSFSAVLLLTVLMIVLAGARMVQLRSQVEALSGIEAEKAERANRWYELNVVNLTRAVYLAKAENHPRLAAIAANEMKATSDEIVANSKRMRELATDEESKAIITRIDAEVGGYLDIRKQAMAKLAAGDPGAQDYVDNAMVPAAQRYMETVKSLREVQARNVATQAQAVADATSTALATLAIGCAITLVLGGWLAWSATRAVTRPLHEAVAASQGIAQGDLGQPIGSDRADELGDLLRSLQAMQLNLRRMVQAVRETSESINVASSEVASGNQDLSSRTEHAASSLQETASSMEQLTGTVRQSADAARQANALAANAAQVAERGGQMVSQVVATMGEISASSSKIADIIGVIDGIAFQTNILALNAAVEAARAGEQGRGFAVVAGEVRSLAQRSAQAAREIKGLIGASGDKVQEGASLVRDAGTAMSDIVSAVQRVSDMMGDIHAAATEQSEGIGQVNTAVTHLDQMTQQNAALVEQSAAAAESLREQADRLTQTVRTFRLGQPAPMAA